MIRDVVVYDIPLRVPFRGIDRRTGVLFRGEAGWAEWSPFEEYADDEAATWLRAALEVAHRGFPPPVRQVVPVNAIVPALPPEAAAERARAAGCRTAKVKVAQTGQSLDDDVARVAAVRAALGPGARIRVDANGAWSLAEATQALRELSTFGLEYAEQPCATVEKLAELRRALSARDIAVPIAADESIRRAEDPLRVRALDAADLAVLKVQPIGGVRRCLEVAEQLAMPVVVSSAVETSVGLCAGVALAAALPELPFDCGLETANLLSADVTRAPLVPVEGSLLVGQVVVDDDRLAAVRATGPTKRRWFERLWRVARIVGEEIEGGRGE
ncbi:o-succinylbenzoate synthase [Tessaracoccus caeni]|uniref:o-succinylbenzoate synthase n=1 Tax=Tessaracoccus caeni TaxID=3031239 RepID=UPI0023DB45FA|nr:o-succinylbenzoate synthase [Tessaracoccus caeni]MDF1487069.1 o-succinylbenzoate synthase [Tessaracoccus caeni]